MTRNLWGTAIAIGVLAAALTLPEASATAQRTQQFVFTFHMSSPRQATAEIFVNRGSGIEVDTAITVPIVASLDPLPYTVPLAIGRYRTLRLDPLADAGDFTIQNPVIRDRYGRTVVSLLPSKFEPSEFVTIHETTADRIVATAAAGHVDPKLQYRFDDGLVLWLSQRDLVWFALLATLVGIVAAGVAYVLLQRFDQPIAIPLSSWPWMHRPRPAIVIVAVLASIAATYPLLLGHSLVTPNNGAKSFVYDSPPYAAGSSDIAVESARFADVQATMWVVLPYAVAQRAALAHGEWPWWNRYSENGVPLLGQGQGAFFDPLQWLLFRDNLALGADLKFIVARFVFTLGTGLAVWTATHALVPALVVTVAAPFISHFIGRFNDPIHFSIVYAPWILFAYGELLRSTTVRRQAFAAAVLLAATGLVIVASSLKECFALLPALHLAGIVALAADAKNRRKWRPAIGLLGFVAIACVGAVLLTAPHWVTFLETLSNAFTAYDRTAFEFAHLQQAVALVAGIFSPGPVYPGVNPVVSVLVLIGLTAPGVLLRTPLLAGSAIVAMGALIVAFGVVPQAILTHLPMFSRIHHVGTTFLTAALPLLLLVAAAGALHRTRRRFTRPSVAVAVAIVVGSAFIGGLSLTADISDPIVGWSLVASIWSGVLCYVVLINATQPTYAGTMVVVITGVSLLVPGGLHLPTGLPALDTLFVQPRERAPLTTLPDVLLPVRNDGGEPARLAGLNGVMPSGVPTFVGIEAPTGGDSLFAPYTYRLGQQFEPDFFPLSFRSPDLATPRLAPLLDLWNVRWLAVPSTSVDRLALVERATAWPRAFFVDRIEAHADRNTFVARLRINSRPFVSVNAGDTDAVARVRAFAGAATAVMKAREYALTANTTAFTVDTPSAGVVVLNETFWPGVSARIGEETAAVFRVNETMRAVVVPKGVSRIVFSYRPTTWNLSLALAAVGATILLLLALVAFGKA